MTYKKKLITIIFLFFLIISFSQLNYADKHFLQTNTNAVSVPKIILDAGHGGFDGGAIAKDGTVEKDINLNICLFLCDFLEQSGFEVIMTRTEDVSTENSSNDKISSKKKSDLQNRLDLMNTHPDAIFISIHLNKFTTSSAKGSQVFFSDNKDSELLADYIQNSIIEKIQKDNTRVNKKATSSTYILYNATIPCVLVECGFLSNNSELELLKTSEYQNKMAFCVYCGIMEFFKKS